MTKAKPTKESEEKKPDEENEDSAELTPEEGVSVEVTEEIEDVEEPKAAPAVNVDVASWNPRTEIGKKVKAGEITDIDTILDGGNKILEAEIVDALLPGISIDLLFVGQSKGKFGGGQRRVFRQTQKKTQEGNKPKFSTVALVGDNNGHIGIGYGKSKETVPAREKATRNAKKAIIKIRRGCGSWECGCRQPHTIPYAIEGRCGSVRIKLLPAPKGTGLCVEKECAKILAYAGIKDIWSKARGQTRTKINMIKALEDALKKLYVIKVRTVDFENLGIVDSQKDKTDENPKEAA